MPDVVWTVHLGGSVSYKVMKHELRDGSSEPDASHRRVPDPSFDRRDARLSRQVRRDYRSHALVEVAEGHLKVRRPLQWAIRPGGGANADKREKAVCPLSTRRGRSGGPEPTRSPEKADGPV